MKKFSGYEEIQAYTESAKLPTGGYIMKVQNVRLKKGQDDKSDMLILAVDVLEGEYKGFYKKQYDSQIQEDKKWKGIFMIYCPKDDGSEKDTWTKRRFKTIMENIEASNPGYSWNWDENTLKGKVFGGLVGEINTVIDGRNVTYNAVRFVTTVENVKKGNYRMPDPLYKNGASADLGVNEKQSSEFENIPEGADEEIPF